MNSRLLLIALLLVLLSSLIFSTALAQDLTPLPDADTAGEIVDLTIQAAEGTATTMQNWVDRLLAAPQSDAMRVLFVLGGILLLVAGWRVYDYIVVIAGFLIGASIGASLVTTESSLIVVAAMLIGGMLGAALGFFLYYAAVFVIGAYIGVILTNALALALSTTPVSPLVLLIGGLIGGMILIGLSFEFLVVLSSIVGAQMLVRGLGLDSLWILIFAVMGVVLQFTLMRTYKYDFRRRRRAPIFQRMPG
jgi:hypothetical protein